jgi:hypothetical protein
MDVQVNGKVPTISIDKTDGCQVYLSKESMTADIISAKSSEMNILLPKDDGEFVSMSNVAHDKSHTTNRARLIAQNFRRSKRLIKSFLERKPNLLNLFKSFQSEFALPEQYKTKWDGKTLVTKVAGSF